MNALLNNLKNRRLFFGNFGYRTLQNVAMYGVFVGLAGLYISEWKVVTRFIPGYNLKYDTADFEYLREAERQVEADKVAAAQKAVDKVELMKEIAAMMEAK